MFVVDDEPPSLELVSRPLEYHGALVTTCRTLQTPRLMSHMIPNVVVIEVPAADERAYALVREIRAATSRRRAPVPAIALMPTGSSVAARGMTAAGFRAALPQPFRVRDLCATILDVVRSR